MGFIVKKKLVDIQKTHNCFPTEKGLRSTQVIIKLALWSHHNNKPVDNREILNIKNKNKFYRAIIERYKLKTVTL